VIFQVITKVPPLEAGGNLAIPHVPWLQEIEPPNELNSWMGRYEVFNMGAAVLSFRQPVFELGEIVITADGDREIVGAQRKASKWEVEVEEFDNIEGAVTRSQEITNA